MSDDFKMTEFGPSWPNGYHFKDGCHNCWWVFEFDQWEQSRCCTYGLPLPRPATHDEYSEYEDVKLGFENGDMDVTWPYFENWNDWIGGLRVWLYDCGKCDFWMKKFVKIQEEENGS